MFRGIGAWFKRIFTLPRKQRDGVDRVLHLTPGTTEEIGEAVAGAAANAATSELETLVKQEAGKL